MNEDRLNKSSLDSLSFSKLSFFGLGICAARCNLLNTYYKLEKISLICFCTYAINW